MEKFFFLIEILSYVFVVFLFFKKKDMAIVYLPLLVFAHNIIDPVLSASLYYSAISVLILQGVIRNESFYRNNVFAILLFCYLLLLLTRSGDLASIRSDAFSVFWLIICIPLIAAIFKKHQAETIFNELSNCALLILLLFVCNVLMSTVYHFSPTRMYGITGGILYGNIYAAGFNILSLAVFIAALKLIASRKLQYLFLIILAYTFILLSLRRSVMLVASAGLAIAMLTLLFKKDVKKFLFLGALIFLSGYFIYSNTGFEGEFKKRYELRQLNDRELENEPRFFEYNLVYKDMFVYNAYSPLIGFQLFKSAGNYGKGIFELRTLHGDLPSIAHSSGILGLVLYCLMVLTVFKRALSSTSSNLDRSVVFFAAIAFLVFTITGRFTESGCMLLMFLLLMLPLSVKAGKEETGKESETADNN